MKERWISLEVGASQGVIGLARERSGSAAAVTLRLGLTIEPKYGSRCSIFGKAVSHDISDGSHTTILETVFLSRYIHRVYYTCTDCSSMLIPQYVEALL